jgi:TRAP-type C4-dicarboxylate transport system substrate-binding protein
MGVGQIQAAMLSAVGLGAIEPGVTALQMMPMAFRSLDEVTYVRERMQPMLEKRLRDKGYVPLFWGDIGWIRFFSKTQLVDAADVKKRKMFSWAGDTEQIEIQKAAGYRPAPLEVGDILMGLETGQIEVVAQPPFFALAGQLDKFAPHMVTVNWAPMVGAAVITKPAWDSLSTPAKDALLRAAQQTGAEITAAGRKESDDSVAAMKTRGLMVHDLTPSQAAGWQKAAEELYPKFRGHTVPADVFDEVLRLLAEYRSGK